MCGAHIIPSILFCSQVVLQVTFDSFVRSHAHVFVVVVVAFFCFHTASLLMLGNWSQAHLSLYECWSSEVDKLYIIENNRWINKLQGVNNHTSFFMMSDLQSFVRHSSSFRFSFSAHVLWWLLLLLFFCCFCFFFLSVHLTVSVYFRWTAKYW